MKKKEANTSLSTTVPSKTETSDAEVPYSVLRNLRLITSWYNFLIFILNPVLSYLWFYFTLVRAPNFFDEYITTGKLLVITIGYLSSVAIFQFLVAEKIKDRIQERGYAQAGHAMSAIIAVLAVWPASTWLTEQAGSYSDQFGELAESAQAVVLSVAWLVGVPLCTIGSVVWFTVKER